MTTEDMRSLIEFERSQGRGRKPEDVVDAWIKTRPSVEDEVYKWIARQRGTCDVTVNRIRSDPYGAFEQFREHDFNRVRDALEGVMHDGMCVCAEPDCDRYKPTAVDAFKTTGLQQCADLWALVATRVDHAEGIIRAEFPSLNKYQIKVLCDVIKNDNFIGFTSDDDESDGDSDDESDEDSRVKCVCGRGCKGLEAEALRRAFKHSNIKDCNRFWVLSNWTGSGTDEVARYKSNINWMCPWLEEEDTNVLAQVALTWADDVFDSGSAMCVCGGGCAGLVPRNTHDSDTPVDSTGLLTVLPPAGKKRAMKWPVASGADRSTEDGVCEDAKRARAKS